MKRDYRLDVIRTAAILMIFTFHFCSTIGSTGIFYGYANGGWGSVGTTMFFILSGFLMWKKNRQKLYVKDFYWKRWVSIYPLFYLTFAVAFLVNGFISGNWKYGGEWWRLVFTILGCDNFLGFYEIPTYALVGEWFTAVIVIIYLLYPALHLLYSKTRLWGSMLVYGLYLLNLGTDWFQIVDDANPITGIAMFWSGMLAAEYAEWLKHKYCLIPEVVIAAMIIFVKLPGNALLWKNMLACMIFGILFIGSGYLEGVPVIIRGCSFVSRYSYAVYLCHHFILTKIFEAAAPYIMGTLKVVALYAVCFVITAVVSVLLYQCMEYVKRFLSGKCSKGS